MMHGNNKSRDDFNGMTSKFDQIDMSRTLYQMNIEYILFSITYQSFINEMIYLSPIVSKNFK